MSEHKLQSKVITPAAVTAWKKNQWGHWGFGVKVDEKWWNCGVEDLVDLFETDTPIAVDYWTTEKGGYVIENAARPEKGASAAPLSNGSDKNRSIEDQTIWRGLCDCAGVIGISSIKELLSAYNLARANFRASNAENLIAAAKDKLDATEESFGDDDDSTIPF